MAAYVYYSVIKNLAYSLIKVFSSISVNKYDVSGNIIEENVLNPIAFGINTKECDRRLAEQYYDLSGTEHGTRFYQMFPRMALIFTGMTYAQNRVTSTNEIREWKLSSTNIDDIQIDYQPVPFDFNFQLILRTDGYDYMFQYIEQIFAYFNPKIILRVKEFSLPSVNIERDIPIGINSINFDIPNEISEEDYRQILCTLDITAESHLYRSTSTSNIIKFINSSYTLSGNI